MKIGRVIGSIWATRKAACLQAANLASAQRGLKNWGVLFTDGGRRRLVTAEEARILRQQGRRPGMDAVLTPLAKEILEGTQ